MINLKNIKIDPKKIKDSLTWFATKLREILTRKKPTDKKIKDNSFEIGNLYIYNYDPKYKTILPYYDTFPIIILLEKYSDGFLGLNLHYLPIQVRIAFLNKLLPYASKDKDGNILKLKVTYELLKNTEKLKEFRPCLKKYLFNHVKSKIEKIPSEEWEQVAFIPSEQFIKATSKEVWNDSMKLINKK